MRTKELFAFIKERHAIYIRRAAGQPKPWTRDPILQQYRFCNIYRELDAVTQWIAANWRKPHKADTHLWFAMVVARLFNSPETLQAIGYSVPWQPSRVKKILHERQDVGLRNFNTAYMVATNGCVMNKIEYLAQYVLEPLWRDRKKINAVYSTCNTLAWFHRLLMQYQGLGSFMAAQVVADLKYVQPLHSATDWWMWAASGPGSRRGLNRVMGYEVNAPWNEATWYLNLMTLKAAIDPLVAKAGMPPIHAQDLQNSLCEWDKYERTRLGQGRPRQLYPGGA